MKSFFPGLKKDSIAISGRWGSCLYMLWDWNWMKMRESKLGCHFWKVGVVCTCLYMFWDKEGMISLFGKSCSFCSSPPTVSSYFLKRQCRSALISFFGNAPLDPKVHINYQFPFLVIWPWKSIGEYLNEINTKHCHTTTFRKPLTRATHLIDPEIT